MRKFILSFALLLGAFTMFAQNESEHLTFKGVPIDGTLDEYIAKMRAVGFTYFVEHDGIALLQGDFAGYKACTIGVSTLKAVDVVSSIAVVFPTHEEWSSLERDYEHLKSMLTQKYGKPSEVVEKFQGNSIPTTNNSKLHELNMDRCTWYTTYETPKGSVQLSLQKQRYGEYFVLLKYYDKINTDIFRSAAMDDL